MLCRAELNTPDVPIRVQECPGFNVKADPYDRKTKAVTAADWPTSMAVALRRAWRRGFSIIVSPSAAVIVDAPLNIVVLSHSVHNHIAVSMMLRRLA
jgi:hypothetical protein